MDYQELAQTRRKQLEETATADAIADADAYNRAYLKAFAAHSYPNQIAKLKRVIATQKRLIQQQADRIKQLEEKPQS